MRSDNPLVRHIIYNYCNLSICESATLSGTKLLIKGKQNHR